MRILKLLILLAALTGLVLAEGVHKAPNGTPFPEHWGEPPRIQTRDLRPLPGDFGRGSGTLARWIQQNLEADKKAGKKPGNAKPAAVHPKVAKIQAMIATKEAEIRRREADLTTYNPATKADLDKKLNPIKQLRAEVAALKAQIPAGAKADPNVAKKIEDARHKAAFENMLASRKQELAELRREGGKNKAAREQALEKEITRLKRALASYTKKPR